jgi:hypothetical protein
MMTIVTGMRRLALMVGAVVVMTGGMVAQAGPAYPLGRKATCADVAVEVELNLAKAPEGRSATGIRGRAMARARVTATFFGTAADLPRPLEFYLPDRTWRQAEKRGRLRAILFAGRPTGTPKLLFGVEGAPTDVDPDYPEVRAAVLRYARWRDRRGEPAVLAEAEKTLATTANRSIAGLAWAFLCSSGHPDAIARAAHLVPPSSSVATMAKDGATCRADFDCRDW